MSIWDKPALTLMERALDAATIRQKVIANNIANVDTPYFKRSEVRFEELLERELQSPTLEGWRTHPRHIPIGKNTLPQPEIVTDEHTAMNNNLNNVDIDYEMALMAKNQLRYNVLIQQVNNELKMFRTAMNGGR
jgi:flagellar basal-body rod protein FlgB